MGKQALGPRLTALAAQVEALTTLVQALAETPAPASKTPAKGGRKASKAKAARKALREANIAAGRMASARYGCATAKCPFGSYNKAPAEAHTLKAGHKAVELS